MEKIGWPRFLKITLQSVSETPKVPELTESTHLMMMQ